MATTRDLRRCNGARILASTICLDWLVQGRWGKWFRTSLARFVCGALSRTPMSFVIMAGSNTATNPIVESAAPARARQGRVQHIPAAPDQIRRSPLRNRQPLAPRLRRVPLRGGPIQKPARRLRAARTMTRRALSPSPAVMPPARSQQEGSSVGENVARRNARGILRQRNTQN